MNKQALRSHVINILDDEHGISQSAYENLQSLVQEVAPQSCDDIFNSVNAAEGRVFLNEDHGIIA